MDAKANLVRKQFSQFGETDFVDWFQEGCTEYYSAANERAFAPAFAYIRKLDSISDDLAWIYDKLVPLKKQPLFRRAIAEVLKTRAGDLGFPVDAVSELVYLISKVKAVESLYCLPRIVATGRIRQDTHWLLFESLAQIKQWLPRKPAIDALYAMVTSRAFEDRYTFDVLTALCIKDPDRWPAHFKLLSGGLSRQVDQAADDQKLTRLLRLRGTNFSNVFYVMSRWRT
jgi:hypothetical protein